MFFGQIQGNWAKYPFRSRKLRAPTPMNRTIYMRY